ncbi:MAG TPA: zf-HC2 domain-containing protein [Patescibacteria group bacterium]|nr:zf-HC2 domain-containing protein [Patescibacteria group bacterium]
MPYEVKGMDCRNAFELLSADLDGELTRSETEALHLHLGGCAHCARRRSLLEITRQAYRSIGAEPVSTGFADAVMRRVRRRAGVRWWLPAAAAIAALVAVALLREPGTPPRIAAKRPVPSDSSSAHRPGLTEGRMGTAADCGLPGAAVCVLDTPCGNGECSPVLPRPRGI